jgi:hypothetical protein
MGGFHLERTVVCPQVYRVGDAGATALIDLGHQSTRQHRGNTQDLVARGLYPYHLGRLWTGYIELEVGIFLPVAEEEGKLEQESIVGISEGS